MADTETMRESALQYADRNWPIFPVNYVKEDLQHGICQGHGCKGCSGSGKGCSCRRDDCDRVGKHPVRFLASNGFKSASTDPELIAGWWKHHPYNIGLWCRGLIVIDVEEAAILDKSFDAWVGERTLPDTMTVHTGGNGLHYYFRVPDGIHVSQRNGLIPKVDTRTTDGYVLLPPSSHVRGSYDWFNTSDFVPATAPNWLIDECAANEPLAVVTSETPIADGSRNISLYRIACAMRGNHGQYGVYLASEPVILAACLAINKLYVKPPKPESEVYKAVHSACTRKTAKEQMANSRQAIDAMFTRASRANNGE